MKDFPHLKPKDIECFTITESSYNNGFAGVRFSLPAGKRKRGYHQSDHLNFKHT